MSLTSTIGTDVGAGLGALSSLFPTTTTTNMNGSSSSNGTGTTSQSYLDPNAQALLSQLVGQYTSYAAQPLNMSGYQATQSNQINQNANANANYIQQKAASMGLSDSPVLASELASNKQAQTAQQNQLTQSIPLLRNQLESNNMGQAASFLNSIPKNITQTQNQNTTQQQTATQKSGGGIGGLLSGAAGALGTIFSDEKLKDDIKPMKTGDSIKILSKLSPIKFKWKENGTKGSGFSAQDVKKVMPDSVFKDDSGFHKMDMLAVIPHLVNAVNELGSIRKKAA